MNVLAIDTSTDNLVLALAKGSKLYEYRLNSARKLSVLLAPVIKRATEAAGLKISDIDFFCCGLGPGSFTGLRIGLAAIKGLSVINGSRVIGVPSLDILAKNAEVKNRLIVTALDARRGLIYCCSYINVSGGLKRKSRYRLLSLDDFIQEFRREPVILGDAVFLYKDKFLAAIKGAIVLDKDYWTLKSHNLMELALAKIKAGNFSSALTIKPIYLYPKECQIKTR